jgi:hypothetical protein
MKPATHLVLALAAGAFASSVSAAHGESGSLPVVTTLAGTGNAGIADGPGNRAEFEGPTGAAYDATGNLYVADAPAQRIRMVDPSGTVTTIAGSGDPILFGTAVAGGYRDGAAATARFSYPSSIAVAADGTIYVGDLLNHCIRRIRDGTVTTYAGDAAKAGGSDGTAARATFASPRGLAVGRDGTIFVADPPNGVRRISPDGIVSTMKVPGFEDAWTVAIFDGGGTNELVVADRYQILAYDLLQNRVTGTFATAWPFGWLDPSAPSPSEGGELTGPVVAIAPIGASEFVYVDPVYSTVRLVQLQNAYTRVLGEQPLLNAGRFGGGFRDGTNALFLQPTGVAVGPSGQIAVADTGNKRIRLLGQFDRVTAGTRGPNQGFPLAPRSGVFRVTLLGDSFVWTNVARAESIGGTFGSRLCSVNRQLCNTEVYPLRFDRVRLPDFVKFVDGVLLDGRMNDVYLFLSSADTGDEAVLESSLLTMKTTLAPSRTRLVVVFSPSGSDLPVEMSYRKTMVGPGDPADALRAHQGAIDAAKRAGVEYIDLWPTFFANDAKLGFLSLYGAWDDHLTYFGNGLVGNALADDLLRSLSAGAGGAR